MLAQLADATVVDLVRRTGLPRRTNHTVGTVGTVDELISDLEGVRSRGFALDDEEDEYAARCRGWVR